LNFPQTVKKASGIPFGNRVFTGPLPRKKNALIGHFQEFAADRKDFSFFFQSNVVLQFILKNNIVRKKINEAAYFRNKKKIFRTHRSYLRT
jgi:hypothetical protein